MDSQRLILFFVFSFSLFFLMDAWQRDQKPQTPVTASGATVLGKGTSAAGQGAPTPIPAAPSSPATAAPSAPQVSAAPPQSSALAKGEVIRVVTDTMRAEIALTGGDIRSLEFLQHKGTLDKTKNFMLFQSAADHTYIAQSGLIGTGLPNHRSVYTATAREYRLSDGSQTLEVRLDAPESSGIKSTLTYKFSRGSYVIDLTYDVTNGGAAAVPLFGYYQLVRDSKPPDGDSAMLPTFTGPAVYTKAEKFQKVVFSDIDKGKTPYSKTGTEGWVAIIQHYFLSAFLPKDGLLREFYTKKLDGGLYAAGLVVTGGSVEPGKSGSITTPLYAGPQATDKLEKLAPGLELVIDYGVLTIIAVPLFAVLAWIHQWVNNWGIAIILLTVLIKLLFYPLQEASYRAMAKMKVIAPKMQKLKEQYGDDRQRMQKAVMEMYQKEKVNPMAGCLPILVQMPVFIALYWVILASVDLRHAPFYGWITDLSAIDPWYILPVLMGASMIIQTRLNPEPPDPVQAKVMKIMPIAFSVFFFFFPAGLVLYWLINNILSIAQQWHINRKIEQAAQKPPAKATSKSSDSSRPEK
jgi:YidC/Oxa1 family membrane protein insertase